MNSKYFYLITFFFRKGGYVVDLKIELGAIVVIMLVYAFSSVYSAFNKYHDVSFLISRTAKFIILTFSVIVSVVEIAGVEGEYSIYNAFIFLFSLFTLETIDIFIEGIERHMEQKEERAKRLKKSLEI